MKALTYQGKELNYSEDSREFRDRIIGIIFAECQNILIRSKKFHTNPAITFTDNTQRIHEFFFKHKDILKVFLFKESTSFEYCEEIDEVIDELLHVNIMTHRRGKYITNYNFRNFDEIDNTLCTENFDTFYRIASEFITDLCEPCVLLAFSKIK